MNFEHKVFINQFPIVKALLKRYQEHQLQNEFWTLTIDAHFVPSPFLQQHSNWVKLVSPLSAPL
jgi:hypothetical protein